MCGVLAAGVSSCAWLVLVWLLLAEWCFSLVRRAFDEETAARIEVLDLT
jgi:hypothetical protein